MKNKIINAINNILEKFEECHEAKIIFSRAVDEVVLRYLKRYLLLIKRKVEFRYIDSLILSADKMMSYV